MTTIKIGKFPGEIKEYVLEDNTTVKEAFAVAGIKEIGAETEVKMDGNVVGMDETIGGAGMLLLTKRLKGAVA